MDEKKLYQQKQQAQLDEWKAELDKLAAQAKGAKADVQIEAGKKIESLKGRIEEGKRKLQELSNAKDAAWESIKAGVDSAWNTIKLALSDAKSKFK